MLSDEPTGRDVQIVERVIRQLRQLVMSLSVTPQILVLVLLNGATSEKNDGCCRQCCNGSKADTKHGVHAIGSSSPSKGRNSWEVQAVRPY